MVEIMTITETQTTMIREAVDIIVRRVPDTAQEAARLLKAVTVDSPIISARFRTLVDNAFGGTERQSFTEEETRLIGETLILLAGEGTPERGLTLRFRVTSVERDRIAADAESAGTTLSQHIRQRLLQ